MMPSIKLDWTVNVGHVVTVAIFVFGGLAAWFQLREDVRVLTTRIDYTENAIEEIKDNQLENKTELLLVIQDLRQDIRNIRR
jgi:hypothetical protein